MILYSNMWCVLSSGILYIIVWFIMPTPSLGQQLTIKGDSQFAVLGEPFNWECDVSAYPSAVMGIEFKLNGTTICNVPLSPISHNCSRTPGDGSPRIVCGCHGYDAYRLYLNISRSQMTDTGDWVCRLSPYNLHSLPVKHVVNYGPGESMKLNIPKTNVSVKEGTGLRLSCSAICLPICLYYWFKDNSLLVNSSSLELTNVQQQDSGLYICQAENIVSQNTTQIKILVLDEPLPPRDLKHVFSTSDTVCLAWRTGDDGGATHVFHVQIATTSPESSSPDWKDTGDIIDEPVIGGPVTSCIRALDASSSYYFRVYASNEHHTGNTSSVVEVNTEDVASGAGPSFGSGIGVGLGTGLVLLVCGFFVGICYINKRHKANQGRYYETDFTTLVR